MLSKSNSGTHAENFFLSSGRVCIFAAALLSLFLNQTSFAGDDANEYVQKFISYYSSVKPVNGRPDTLSELASKATYDSLFMGAAVKKTVNYINNKQNEESGMAWSVSYHAQSLNWMYQATGDPNYLTANLEIIRAALAQRDDKRGVKIFSGEITPAWGCKLDAKNRTIYAVYTGIIILQIFDFLNAVKADKHLQSILKIGDSKLNLIASQAAQSLDWHQRQWHDVPGGQEGFYSMKDEEEGFDPNLPQPVNRLSLMGIALWESWKFSGNVKHREKAIKLAQYIKRRLTIYEDAYYWGYWLPEKPVDSGHKIFQGEGEDVEHAGTSISFPLRLAQENVVFTRDDIKLFSNTVKKGFARLNNGILFGDITGKRYQFSAGFLDNTGYWLGCSQVDRDVYARIAEFLVKYYLPRHLELAALIKYRPDP